MTNPKNKKEKDKNMSYLHFLQKQINGWWMAKTKATESGCLAEPVLTATQVINWNLCVNRPCEGWAHARVQDCNYLIVLNKHFYTLSKNW